MASASYAIQLDLLADLQPIRAGDAGPGSGTVSSPEACGGGARVHQLDAGLDCVRGLLRRAYLPLRAHSGGARAAKLRALAGVRHRLPDRTFAQRRQLVRIPTHFSLLPGA